MIFRRKQKPSLVVVPTAKPSPELEELVSRTKELVRKVNAAMDSIISKAPERQQ